MIHFLHQPYDTRDYILLKKLQCFYEILSINLYLYRQWNFNKYVKKSMIFLLLVKLNNLLLLFAY